MKPQKKTKSSVRDTWIPLTWRYNGSGYQRNKKAYTRKEKYKRASDSSFYYIFIFFYISPLIIT